MNTHLVSRRSDGGHSNPTLLATIALLLAASALAVSIVCYALLPDIPRDKGASTPREAIFTLYHDLGRYGGQDAESAYWHRNRKQVLASLEVTDVQEKDGLALAFVRFSIGSDIYRQAYWLRQVGGKWYLAPYTSKYFDDSLSENSWFEHMDEKKTVWEKESAKRKWN